MRVSTEAIIKAVQEEGNQVKAANRLGISQSSVSKRLAAARVSKDNVRVKQPLKKEASALLHNDCVSGIDEGLKDSIPKKIEVRQYRKPWYKQLWEDFKG